MRNWRVKHLIPGTSKTPYTPVKTNTKCLKRLKRRVNTSKNTLIRKMKDFLSDRRQTSIKMSSPTEVEVLHVPTLNAEYDAPTLCSTTSTDERNDMMYPSINRINSKSYEEDATTAICEIPETRLNHDERRINDDRAMLLYRDGMEEDGSVEMCLDSPSGISVSSFSSDADSITRRRRVQFSSKLVSEVRERPRTNIQESGILFYTKDELESFYEEWNNESDDEVVEEISLGTLSDVTA